MEKMKVRELMVPVGRFPKISSEATFYEALQALEDAQKKYLAGESEQRILLVEGTDGNVVSKISPIDLIRGLESDYEQVVVEKTISRFGLGFARKSMQDQYRLWQTPFRDLCRKAIDVKIKDFIKIPDEGQRVGIDDPIARAFDCFVMGRHDSLFVVEDNKTVGLLRFSDVYKKISLTMHECGLATNS
jgi:hypothetical protein